MNPRHIFLLGLLPIFVFTACKRDADDPEDPHDHNEEELITTVEIHLTGGDGSHTMAHWRDTDGPGGNDPEIDTLVLDSNLTYTGMIEFVDESGDEAVDITHEIEEEGAEHLVCYSTDVSEVEITRTDSDGTHEIGLATSWRTLSANEGTLTITLKHQPDVKDGTCAPGETDVEVDFPIVIQ